MNAPNQSDNDVARLAARLCEAPLAFVARDDSPFWRVTGALGRALDELPESDPLCACALSSGTVLEVRDILQEPWLQGSRLVGGSAKVRGLATIPIVVQGRPAGFLAVASPDPRPPLTQLQRESLVDLAALLGRSWSAQAVPAHPPRVMDRGFRLLVDRMPEAFLLLRDGRVLYANARCGELLRRAPSVIIGLALRELVPGEILPALEEVIRAAELEPSLAELTHETRIVRPDGTTSDVELRMVRVLFEGSLVHGCLVRDLAERRAMQTRLLLADRMASVGTLSAGVAHGINNPLAFIIINMAFAAEHLERFAADAPPEIVQKLGVSELLEALSEAQVGAQRVHSIVRDLRTFANADRARREPVNLRSVVETCVNMAWNEIRHRAQLERDFDEVPPIEANEAQIAQVFLNLLVNAAQAIETGDAGRHVVRLTLRRLSENTVRFSVADTGSGIAPATLAHIFDPFFTTKPVGVGTGLGLAVCHSIVTGLGGTISVVSNVDRGSTFTVDLPMRPPAAPRPVERPPPVGPVRRGRVLVVDDELSVGSALKRGLRAYHDVDAVSSGRQALEQLAVQPDYDVILCDVMMPDISGMDLHAELQRTLPRLAERMAFITGGVFAGNAQEFLDRIPNRRVEKPIDLNRVKNLLQEVMAQTHSRYVTPVPS
jgi:two-component system cell cycle sensor histidine kinase/response regulator CckA